MPPIRSVSSRSHEGTNVPQQEPPLETNADAGYIAPPALFGSPLEGLISQTDSEAVVRLDDGRTAHIPASDPLFATALALSPVSAPPDVPGSVSNAQARAALRAAGLIGAVEAAIAAQGNPAVADAWEYAPYINRDSVLVASLGAALGLTSQQVDDLFIAAAGIVF